MKNIDVINNEVVSEQTKMLTDLISKHYQYYYQQSMYQQSMELHTQDKILSAEFYQDFIDNLSIELEHIDFDFPIAANLGYVMTAEQVSRWAVYWHIVFHEQSDSIGNKMFACTIELMTPNKHVSGFKLICENGTSNRT